jgi:hypothetical protein
MRLSSMNMSPAFGSTRPAIIRNAVVLPQPLGPSSPMLPGATTRIGGQRRARGLAVFAANLQPTGSSIHLLTRGVAARHLWAKLTT